MDSYALHHTLRQAPFGLCCGVLCNALPAVALHRSVTAGNRTVPEDAAAGGTLLPLLALREALDDWRSGIYPRQHFSLTIRRWVVHTLTGFIENSAQAGVSRRGFGSCA